MTGPVEAAVAFALSTEGGWREEDVVGLLRGCARYANGAPVPVCERCGKLEYVDGLIPTMQIAEDIIGGGLCPQCKATRGDYTEEEHEST